MGREYRRWCMAAPDGLIRLVEPFRDNRETCLSPEFNGTAVRLQFIEPLFELPRTGRLP